MQSKIAPLSKRARSILPDRVSQDTGLHKLAPLTLLLLVYIGFRWNERRFEIAHIPTWKRTTDHYTFRVSLRELHAHLKPGAAARHSNHDYRHVVDAVDALSQFQVKDDLPDVKGKRGRDTLNLLAKTSYREEGAVLVFTLSAFFVEALQMLEARGVDFTQTPMTDALALADTRHVLLLMLAAKAAKFYVHDRRTFAVGWLREYFGLTASTYDNWSEAFRKLKAAAAAVTFRTSYRVKLIPVPDRMDSRRIVAVRFDVKQRDAQPQVPAIEHRPKPTISLIARKRLLREAVAREREREGGSCVADIYG